MRRAYAALALIAMLSMTAVGCGNPGNGAGTESPAAVTSPAQSPAPESTAPESPAPESPAAGWSTVVTLSSADPTNDMDLHVSDEFTVSGDAQVVLDIPGGEDMDGVVAAFLPAGEPITVSAGAQAESVALAGALPSQVVSGLDGDYVLLVTPSTTRAWTVEVQTQE